MADSTNNIALATIFKWVFAHLVSDFLVIQPKLANLVPQVTDPNSPPC